MSQSKSDSMFPYETQNNYTVVLKHPDLGSTNAQALAKARHELLAAIDASNRRPIEIELYCRVAGASFVGILAEVSARAKKCGTSIILRHVDDAVARVVRVCGYGHLIGSHARQVEVSPSATQASSESWRSRWFRTLRQRRA